MEVKDVYAAIEEMKSAATERIEDLAAHLVELEKKFGRLALSGNDPAGETLNAAQREHKHAFLGWIRTGRESAELVKAMQSISDPDGGYLVPRELDTQLTKYLRERSPLRRLARVVSIETSSFEQPHSTGGTGSAWVGETQSRAETSSPEIKMANVPVFEVYANPKVTQRLLDDNAFNLEGWLVEELGDAFADAEGAAFITGDGVARPRGLFTYTVVTDADATRAHNKFQYIASGAAGAFAATDPADALISLVYAVKPAYRRNASWLLSPEVLEKIRKFKDSQGQKIWQPSMAEGQPSRLFGYPVEEDENVPALAANSLSIAFGDFSRSYTIVDRSKAMLRDPYTGKPFVHFYTTMRVGGGGGRDTRAVKFMKFAAS